MEEAQARPPLVWSVGEIFLGKYYTISKAIKFYKHPPSVVSSLVLVLHYYNIL